MISPGCGGSNSDRRRRSGDLSLGFGRGEVRGVDKIADNTEKAQNDEVCDDPSNND